MGFFILISLTFAAFIIAGPPLIMAYAALREKREKQEKALAEAAAAKSAGREAP